MSANIKIMFLEQKNPHPRDDDIRFEEGPHLYFIRGVNNNISVTTFVHHFFQEFNEDLVIQKMRRSPKWETSPYYGMSDKEIKDQWEANRVSASSAGTKMHYDIELFYNQEPVDNQSVEYKYFLDFHRKQVSGGNLVPYRTEWVVYDEEYQLAGSIDMLFQVGDDSDQIVIYDWKRCKKISKTGFDSAKPPIDHLPDSNYWHYALQLNMYRYILQKNYGKKVTGLFLVCLHPNQSNYQQIKVPFLDDEVKDLLAYRQHNLVDWKK